MTGKELNIKLSGDINYKISIYESETITLCIYPKLGI